jgi:hypothetical protein
MSAPYRRESSFSLAAMQGGVASGDAPAHRLESSRDALGARLA